MYITGLLARLYRHFKYFPRKMYVIKKKRENFAKTKHYSDFLVKKGQIQIGFKYSGSGSDQVKSSGYN